MAYLRAVPTTDVAFVHYVVGTVLYLKQSNLFNAAQVVVKA